MVLQAPPRLAGTGVACQRRPAVDGLMSNDGFMSKYDDGGGFYDLTEFVAFPEEIAKERRPRASSKEKHAKATPVPEWSESEDSFEKEETSEEEETP